MSDSSLLSAEQDPANPFDSSSQISGDLSYPSEALRVPTAASKQPIRPTNLSQIFVTEYEFDDMGNNKSNLEISPTNSGSGGAVKHMSDTPLLSPISGKENPFKRFSLRSKQAESPRNSLLLSAMDNNLTTVTSELRDALGTPSSMGTWMPLNAASRARHSMQSTDCYENEEEDDEDNNNVLKGAIKLQNLPVKAPSHDPSLEYLSPRYAQHFPRDSEADPNASSNSLASGNSELKRRLTVAVNKFSSRVVHGDEPDKVSRRVSQHQSNISILNDSKGDGDITKTQSSPDINDHSDPSDDRFSFSDKSSRKSTSSDEAPDHDHFNKLTSYNSFLPENPGEIEFDAPISAKPSEPIVAVESETPDLYKRDWTSANYNRNLGLYGKTLMFFGPYHVVRVSLARILESVPDAVFLVLYILYTAILCYQTWNPPITNPFFYTRHFDWAELVIMLINVILTIEITAKVISYGFYDNSQFYEEFNLERKDSLSDKLIAKIKVLFRSRSKASSDEMRQTRLKHSFTLKPNAMLSKSEMDKINHPFCRSNWNVIDLISCLTYWIDFIIRFSNTGHQSDVSILRFFSCARILRLSRLTEGTFTITRSLEHALPQLANICLFIVYFWLILSIAGVQTFKSSFQRQCVYTDPTDSTITFTNQDSYQFCGAWLDPDTGQSRPYLLSDGVESSTIKGYYCPRYSKCVAGQNPYNGTVSFDNILHSLELVYVIISMNTFTDLMYYSMDAENMAGSIFFVVAIFLLSIWLLNIFVAVIVSSFKITSEMSKAVPKKSLNSLLFNNLRQTAPPIRISSRLDSYNKFEFIWVIFITGDMIFQALVSAKSSDKLIHNVNMVEIGITYLLLFEIILRFCVYLPHWRYFLAFKRNQFDLVLAIITSVLIIPPVRESLGQTYNWLTVFSIMRFYRVVVAVKFVRELWLDVIGNVKTIANLTLFYFLMLFLVSIMTSLLFEGVIDEQTMEENDFQFALNTLPNTFLALYVITSTENWTSILYLVQQYGRTSFTRAMGSIVLIGWFIFSNSIVLNIFIAVIAENLEVGESEKKKQQVRSFVRSLANDLYGKEESLIGNMKKRFKMKNKRAFIDDVEREQESLKQTFALLMAGTIIDDFLEEEQRQNELNELEKKQQKNLLINSKFIKKSKQLWHRMTDFYTKNPFYAKRQEAIENAINPNVLAKNILMEDKIIAARRNDYLDMNPSFNKVLFIFSPENRLRRFCQMFVGPSIGERIGGRPPEKRLQEIFNAIMLLGTVGIVVLACYATPLYTHTQNTTGEIWYWTMYSDLAFALLFLVEFLVKMIADGFIYTPNAMLRSSWNVIDLFVLITLWINLILTLKGSGDSSRIVKGFKAFRALRLLTISDTAKSTFHRIIIAGFGKILGAASVSFCLLFPFSIWGLNIFRGRLSTCNDSNMSREQCFGEYQSEMYNWDVLAPRVYSNPYLTFDNFGHSFSTLFQISSLEGWVDLLGYVTGSTGEGTPTSSYAEPYNALFLVIYMFLAIIFILNLFVSVIISNYSRTSGSAYLTSEQRSWREVEKLLSQVKPTKRPKKELLSDIKLRVYNLVVEDNRKWKFLFDLFLLIQLVNLLMESSVNKKNMELARNIMFLITSVFFFVNSLLRVWVKGLAALRNKWDAFQLLVSGFSTVFQIVLLCLTTTTVNIIPNISKALSLLILTFMIQRSNRLSLLLKFASASLPHLLSLLYTWFILFLVYAIAMNQIFGLTKIGGNGNGNLNARTVTKSLIMLFKMSFGEGWNSIMNDYFLEEPYCSATSQFSDCGNPVYAYVLFISWNIISMYIFLNLFISLVVENFSYVYHRTGPCSLITRQEIRKFKQTWQYYDPDGTGFIPLSDLYAFLHNLNGVLSFKLYDGRLSIKSLKEEWFVKGDPRDPYDFIVDHASMNKTLNSIDVHKVRHRKKQFERFVEEAIYDMKINEYPGISFSKILMQIPLYTQFQDAACLSLKNYLERHLLLKDLDAIIAKKNRINARETFVSRWRFVQYLNNKKNFEKRQEAEAIFSQRRISGAGVR